MCHCLITDRFCLMAAYMATSRVWPALARAAATVTTRALRAAADAEAAAAAAAQEANAKKKSSPQKSAGRKSAGKPKSGKKASTEATPPVVVAVEPVALPQTPTEWARFDTTSVSKALRPKDLQQHHQGQSVIHSSGDQRKAVVGFGDAAVFAQLCTSLADTLRMLGRFDDVVPILMLAKAALECEAPEHGAVHRHLQDLVRTGATHPCLL